MRLSFQNFALPVAALLGVVLAGCTTTPPGPTLLATCQSKLSSCDARVAQCLASVDRLSRQLNEKSDQQAAATVELNNTRQALRQCEAQTEQISERVDSLSAARSELENRLTESIARKDVEIELLNDRLSVRMLDRVLFDSGSAIIRPRGQQVLAEVAGVLADGDEYIRIEGHTDNVPISPSLLARYPSNWELSAARAISVVRLFQKQFSIDPARMEAVGHAFYSPMEPNDTAEQRQKNRRVEVVVTKRDP